MTQASPNNVTAASSSAVQGTNEDGEEDADRQGKKKRKKRANKRTVAKMKEMRKDFMDRCVSPEY